MQYDDLSQVYDKFNDEPDYGKYLDTVFAHFNVPRSGLALDCGCGTGTLLLRLSELGYDCTGTDASPLMLCKAREKLEDAGYKPHLVCQELTQTDLFGAYNVAFCTLDTVNHLMSLKQLEKFFKRLYNFIEPDGFFIFDAKTKQGFKRSEGIRICDEDGVFLAVQGGFTGRYASYRFTMFKNGERTDDDVDECYFETKEIKRALAAAGFSYQGKAAVKNRNIFAAKKEVCII